MQDTDYLNFRARVRAIPAYEEDYQWAQTVKAPENSRDWVREYIWVVLNSGMKNQVAEKIFLRVMPALEKGNSASTVFGHKGKCKAIDEVWKDQISWYIEYVCVAKCEPAVVIEWLAELPWIGHITKFHLAKNYGLHTSKPDRHLVRIANKFNTTPEELCSELAKATGDRIGTVDYILWRAANLGWI